MRGGEVLKRLMRMAHLINESNVHRLLMCVFGADLGLCEEYV